MQNNIIVNRIPVMSVTKPVRSLRMQLNVTHPKRTVYFQFCVKEIGACISIRQTGIYHFDRLSGGCLEWH